MGGGGDVHVMRIANIVTNMRSIAHNNIIFFNRCITNCDDKWNIQEKLVLRGKCPGCIDLQ